MNKICSKCKIEKSVTEFYKLYCAKDSLCYSCKKCCNDYKIKNRQRIRKQSNVYYYKNKEKEILRSRKNYKKNIKKFYARHLKIQYGITPEQYNELILKQNNLCAICNEPESSKDRNGNIKKLSVDHCHKTGKVRRLLCNQCNKGLGCFKDNTELLKKAINYLEMTM